ncbi:MAG: WD40/YVTN/BNR-like repeat-containing protein [Nocardioides sp.]
MRTLLGAVAASLVLVPLTAMSAGAAHVGADSLHWQTSTVGSDQELRGLAPVSARTAWVSGDRGGVFRTTDGGATWADVSPPEGADLLFRDVEATDATHALVLAIGPGDASRIYRTTDAGSTWTATFVNDDPDAFFDCMAMWPGGRTGLAMSDPVDGKFRIIRTTDSGRTWSVVDPAGMPPAADGEFGFAASGTCLATAGGRDAWLVSGGAASRVFHSADGGHTWTVTDSTVPASEAGGTFSVSFRNPRQGLVVGGDYLVPDNGADASAYSRDAGRRWTNGGDVGGYRSGVDWVSGSPHAAIAVGTSGSDLTTDGGRSWTGFDTDGYDAVQCLPGGVCWASGSHGRVGWLRAR